MNNSNSILKFINYIVDDVLYQNNPSFIEKDVQLDLKIIKDVQQSEKELVVTLTCLIFENAEKNNYPFHLKIKITGLFEIVEGDINKFSINAVTILFPYIRALISTLTANFNIQPLILPPINVMKLFED